MVKKKLIVGNWKMNPVSPREAGAIFAGIKAGASIAKKATTVICPPFIFITDLVKSAKAGKVKIGAQAGIAEVSGACTGEISIAMIAATGAEYIILGHSERRAVGETDEEINKEVRTALKTGLRVILCVGEKIKDEHGDYLSFVKDQLTAALSGVPKNQLGNLIIAYEPVWAIGAGATESETPENFLHNALFVRKTLDGLYDNKVAHSTPILYGGSVDKKNAADFLTRGEADGLLIGRASLDPVQLAEIIKLADQNA